jgi:drug/metabolite transporter, DME family
LRSPLTSLSYTILFGTLTLLVLLGSAAGWAAYIGDANPLRVFEVGRGTWNWPILIILALGPTLGGYGIFTSSLRHVPARIASLIVVIEAPIATLLAVWLVGERLEMLQIVGIGCILGAIILPTMLERFVGAPLISTDAIDGARTG